MTLMILNLFQPILELSPTCPSGAAAGGSADPGITYRCLLNRIVFLAGHGTDGDTAHVPGGSSSLLHVQGGPAGQHVRGQVKPGLQICEERLQGAAANRRM